MMIEKFLEDLRLKRYAKATLESYETGIRQFREYLAAKGITSPQKITIHTLNDYRKHLETSEKKYSVHTVHIRLRAIRNFFRYLEENHQLLVNPAEKLILPKIGDRLPKDVLSREEIRKLLHAPNTSISIGIRDRALLETLYSTGIRLSECEGLNVYDVDADGGHLRVNKGKGSKDRIVPLGQTACRWLKEYLDKVRPFMMREEKLRRLKGNQDERALWITYGARRLAKGSIDQMIKRYAKKSGIPRNVTVHSFRRSFATHMLEEGANPYYVQQILGHTHGHTIRHYMKLMPKETKKAHARHHPREKGRWKQSLKSFGNI